MSEVGLRKKRLETDAWEQHRQVIENLYLDQGQPLEQVMHFMKSKYDFEATEQAYKKKLRRWKISKNIPAHAMECILQQMEARQEQGKDSSIYWHGRLVDAEKIERSRQRMKRERKENPEKQIAPLDQATLRLIRIETPPPHLNDAGVRQLPLRLDIPHVPVPANMFNPNQNMLQNSNIQAIPTFSFTQYNEPMMMDHTPVSATSSRSFFEGEGQITTTQLPLSPILPASDFDVDAMLGSDNDFNLLKLKLSMSGSSPDVQRALQRGNKLLQAGSALLPKTNIESMDVSRQENRDAVGYYRSVLKQHSNGANGTAIADALRHISQIQANSSVPDLQPDESLADRERLLAGFHFMFGNDNPIYLRQVFEFCDKGRASTDPVSLNNQLSMFRTAVQKMLSMDLAIDKSQSILSTANTYFSKGLINQDELEYFFSQIILHHPPAEWWKSCENILFVAQSFLDRVLYDRAEPYLLIIMQQAHKHMVHGDFFVEDQFVLSMFSTLSNHICSGNAQYLSALSDLEADLRNRQRPSQFDCLELTCWILLAAAYVNSLRPVAEVVYMLREAELETRQDRPMQVSWHSIDSITSALYVLARHLRNYMHEDSAQYVSGVAHGISMRWSSRPLYAG